MYGPPFFFRVIPTYQGLLSLTIKNIVKVIMIHQIVYFYVDFTAFIKAVTFIMVIAFIMPAVPPSPLPVSSCSLCYNSFISFTSLIIITFSFCLCKFFVEFRILVVKYITV